MYERLYLIIQPTDFDAVFHCYLDNFYRMVHMYDTNNLYL